MKTPHKHAGLIKAWADGAEIEYLSDHGEWSTSGNPYWNPLVEYRIKPEPKPDLITECKIIGAYRSIMWNRCWPGTVVGANLRLTFDGETGKLKAAEVIA